RTPPRGVQDFHVPPGPPNVHASTPTRGSGTAACPATAGARRTLTCRSHETPSRHLQGLAGHDAIFAGRRTISRTSASLVAMPHSVLSTVSDHCTPAIRGETTNSTLP